MKASYDPASGSWSCVIADALMNYFLRVDPDYGVTQMSKGASSCTPQSLRTLWDLKRWAEIEPAIIEKLNGKEAWVARSAAEVLAKYGGPRAKTAMFERLSRFHEEWAGREKDLRFVRNFSPDGSLYLIYSPDRKSILQKNMQGVEISATPLPDSVEYQIVQIKQPAFSPDGRHISFISRVQTGDGVRGTVTVADVNCSNRIWLGQRGTSTGARMFRIAARPVIPTVRRLWFPPGRKCISSRKDSAEYVHWGPMVLSG